ncbi:MAG: futalosine hydrolase [Agriterribacter sp.]
MNILIVAATAGEVNATQEYLGEKMYQRKDCSVQVLTTGVGLVNTTYVLTKYFSKIKPDLVVQGGIAGSLHPFYPPGTVVAVKEEVFGDLGVEEEHSFKDLFDLDLAENSFPYSSKVLSNPHHRLLNKIRLKQVKAVSVNEITTRAGRTQQIIEKYSAVIESMEGAAFHYVCLQEAIPFLQLRAVSNFIGERDKSKWMIKEAIDNLNKELISFIRPLLCH